MDLCSPKSRVGYFNLGVLGSSWQLELLSLILQASESHNKWTHRAIFSDCIRKCLLKIPQKQISHVNNLDFFFFMTATRLRSRAVGRLPPRCITPPFSDMQRDSEKRGVLKVFPFFLKPPLELLSSWRPFLCHIFLFHYASDDLSGWQACTAGRQKSFTTQTRCMCTTWLGMVLLK